MNDGVSFCPACGAAVGAAAAPQTPPYTPYQGQAGVPPPSQPFPGQSYPGQPYAAQTGLQENVAGLLCYLVGWLTGIIFLLIDKRPFVRFHAAQSIVVFGILFLLRILLGFVFVSTYYYSGLWGFHFLISGLLSLLTLVAWIVLMLMAYQGKRFEVPIAAGIAKSIAGNVQV